MNEKWTASSTCTFNFIKTEGYQHDTPTNTQKKASTRVISVTAKPRKRDGCFHVCNHNIPNPSHARRIIKRRRLKPSKNNLTKFRTESFILDEFTQSHGRLSRLAMRGHDHHPPRTCKMPRNTQHASNPTRRHLSRRDAMRNWPGPWIHANHSISCAPQCTNRLHKLITKLLRNPSR